MKRSILSNALPVPIATQSNGSSATRTGIFVSSLITLSKLRSNAPPPVNTMPRSIMSAANSGGVFSNVFLTDSTMASTVSFNASAISSG